MNKQFETRNGKVPFPRSVNDHIQNGLTPAEADHKMCQDVFGHDYRIDAKGYPIETGRGSAANPASESLKAMEREKSAAEQARMRLGWRKGLMFDPKTAA